MDKQTTTQQYQRTVRVLDLVAAERVRQVNLHRAHALTDDCADPKTDLDACLRVLGEEFGECCREVDGIKKLLKRQPHTAGVSGRLQQRMTNLGAELVQLAAVAVATRESLEGRGM